MGGMAVFLLVTTLLISQWTISLAEPLLRSKDHHTGYSSNNRWGLGLKSDHQDSDLSWLNNMPVEGLLSIYRGKHQHGDLAQLSQFRNNELAPDPDAVGGGNHVTTGRRMSITNAMDILRDRLLRAIKRKQVNTEDYQEVWPEPGLVNIG